VKALSPAFYARPADLVARRLVGHFVVSTVGGLRTVGRIVETEAYLGPHDPASHAYRNRRTERTERMYGQPGTAYVYFTYGMHWCLNAVTGREGYPAAVLIRALEPVAGLGAMRRRRGRVPDRMLCAGPARLCRALGITGKLNGAALQGGPLTILRAPPSRRPIIATPRIGITRATAWPLRYVFADSRSASRPSAAR